MSSEKSKLIYSELSFTNDNFDLLKNELHKKDLMIQELLEQLNTNKRKKFSQSSEQLNSEQLCLFN